MNHDLTSGKPFGVLFRFTLPLFGSMLLQQLYNIVDSLVAGKLVNEQALAAVSDSFEVTLVYLAFAFGCNIGCSVVVSQLFGAGRKRDLKTAVHTTFLFTAVLCAVLTFVGLLAGKPLLIAIDTPAAVLPDAHAYLNIYTLGLLPLFFYNISTGIFSALGDSRTPFWFLAGSSVANIGMDVLFVAVFRLGVPGVAWATFLCQTVSCVLAVVTLLRRLRNLGGEKGDLFSFPLFKRIVSVAIPGTLQQSFISVGNLFIQKSINGYFAEDLLRQAMMAGYGAAMKLNMLTINCLSTVANGVSNFTGQNFGAKKQDRVRAGCRSAIGIALGFAGLFTFLYLVFGKALVGLFLESGSEAASGGKALEIGRAFLLIVSPFYAVVAIKLVFDGVFRGAGATRYFTATTFTDLILRVGLAFLLPMCIASETGGNIWMAWPIGWGVSCLMGTFFYFRGKWKQGGIVL